MTFELRITADTVEELSRIVNRISHEPLTIVDDSKKEAPAPPEETKTEDPKECDNNGVEFDPALHSSAKKMNNDGSWKKRRGAAPPPEGTEETGEQKKAPAPPGDDKPISDFPALMEFLKVDKELSLDQMNELAKSVGVDKGIYSAATMPETFPAIIAAANA